LTIRKPNISVAEETAGNGSRINGHRHNSGLLRYELWWRSCRSHSLRSHSLRSHSLRSHSLRSHSLGSLRSLRSLRSLWSERSKRSRRTKRGHKSHAISLLVIWARAFYAEVRNKEWAIGLIKFIR
jgi:hypothetical protein